MIKVLVNGCNGKMGQEVISEISSNEAFEVVCGVDKNENDKYNFNVYTDLNDIKENLKLSDDSKIIVFRFNNQKCRILGIPSTECNSILYIIGYDWDFDHYLEDGIYNDGLYKTADYTQRWKIAAYWSFYVRSKNHESV